MRNSIAPHFFTIPGAFATEKAWQELSLVSEDGIYGYAWHAEPGIVLIEFLVAGEYTPDFWAVEFNGFGATNCFMGGIVLDGISEYIEEYDFTFVDLAVMVFVATEMLDVDEDTMFDCMKLWVGGDEIFYPDLPWYEPPGE